MVAVNERLGEKRGRTTDFAAMEPFLRGSATTRRKNVRGGIPVLALRVRVGPRNELRV
jgi:hypothetical protein